MARPAIGTTPMVSTVSLPESLSFFEPLWKWGQEHLPLELFAVKWEYSDSTKSPVGTRGIDIICPGQAVNRLASWELANHYWRVECAWIKEWIVNRPYLVALTPVQDPLLLPPIANSNFFFKSTMSPDTLNSKLDLYSCLIHFFVIVTIKYI